MNKRVIEGTISEMADMFAILIISEICNIFAASSAVGANALSSLSGLKPVKSNIKP